MRHNVKLKSGARGWRGRLREVYVNESDLERYDSVYAILTRLGYKTVRGAWKANPMIEGGTNPGDFRRTPKKKTLTT